MPCPALLFVTVLVRWFTLAPAPLSVTALDMSSVTLPLRTISTAGAVAMRRIRTTAAGGMAMCGMMHTAIPTTERLSSRLHL